MIVRGRVCIGARVTCCSSVIGRKRKTKDENLNSFFLVYSRGQPRGLSKTKKAAHEGSNDNFRV